MASAQHTDATTQLTNATTHRTTTFFIQTQTNNLTMPRDKRTTNTYNGLVYRQTIGTPFNANIGDGSARWLPVRVEHVINMI